MVDSEDAEVRLGVTFGQEELLPRRPAGRTVPCELPQVLPTRCSTLGHIHIQCAPASVTATPAPIPPRRRPWRVPPRTPWLRRPWSATIQYHGPAAAGDVLHPELKLATLECLKHARLVFEEMPSTYTTTAHSVSSLQFFGAMDVCEGQRIFVDMISPSPVVLELLLEVHMLVILPLTWPPDPSSGGLSVWINSMASRGQQVFDRGKYMAGDNPILSMFEGAGQQQWLLLSQVGATASICESTGHDVVLPKPPWLFLGHTLFMLECGAAHRNAKLMVSILTSMLRFLDRVVSNTRGKQLEPEPPDQNLQLHVTIRYMRELLKYETQSSGLFFGTRPTPPDLTWYAYCQVQQVGRFTDMQIITLLGRSGDISYQLIICFRTLDGCIKEHSLILALQFLPWPFSSDCHFRLGFSLSCKTIAVQHRCSIMCWFVYLWKPPWFPSLWKLVMCASPPALQKLLSGQMVLSVSMAGCALNQELEQRKCGGTIGRWMATGLLHTSSIRPAARMHLKGFYWKNLHGLF